MESDLDIQVGDVYVKAGDIKFCLKTLVHACQCPEEGTCRVPSCEYIKRAFAHKKICKRKHSCDFCMALIVIRYVHAMDCRQKKCVVPFCNGIRKMAKESEFRGCMRSTNRQIKRDIAIKSYILRCPVTSEIA